MLVSMVAVGLALVLHVVGMFPTYFSSPHRSLAVQADQASLYGVVAGTWLLVLMVQLAASFDVALTRMAAAAAVGVAAGELGFRIADLGQALTRGVGADAGFWLVNVGWLLGAIGAGTAVAAAFRPMTAAAGGPPSQRARGLVALDVPTPRSDRTRIWLTVAAAVTGIGTALAFVPAWDRYDATIGAASRTVHLSAGNAFKGPGLVIAGNVVAAIILGLVPIGASLIRRTLPAAVVIGGLLVSFASQLVAGAVQTVQTQDPTALGVSPAQAQRIGLQLHLQLTPWFWLDVVAAVALAAVAVGLGLVPNIRARQAAAHASSGAAWPANGPWAPAGPWTAPPAPPMPGPVGPGWAPPPGPPAPGATTPRPQSPSGAAPPPTYGPPPQGPPVRGEREWPPPASPS